MNMCERRGFLAKGLLAGEQLLRQQNLNRSQADTLTSLSAFVHLGLAKQLPHSLPLSVTSDQTTTGKLEDRISVVNHFSRSRNGLDQQHLLV